MTRGELVFLLGLSPLYCCFLHALGLPGGVH